MRKNDLFPATEHSQLKLLRLGSGDAHAQTLKPNPCAIETPICDTPFTASSH
jgi:hypothetical protein